MGRLAGARPGRRRRRTRAAGPGGGHGEVRRRRARRRMAGPRLEERAGDDGERRRRCPGWPAARRMAAAAGVRRRGDDAGWGGPRVGLRAGGRGDVVLPRGATWMAEAGGGGRVRPGADTSVGGGGRRFSFFFRVSGRGRDPKTEGCIYRHRGS